MATIPVSVPPDSAYLVRAHLDWLRRTGATPTTCKYRDGVLRRFSAQLPEGVTLLGVTRDHCSHWQSALEVSPSTIAGYTGHLHQFYEWCVEEEYIDFDPTARLPRPKVARRPPRPIPDEDLDIALACAAAQRGPMHAWLVLAAFVGLRAMEIAGMRRQDITAEDGRLFIDGIGKGNKPFRLCVPVDVEPVLRPWLVGSTGPIFRTGRGGRGSRPKDVSAQTRTFFKSLGMPYSIHRCRHTFGTRLYAQTKDLLIVQDLMRHENANTTRGYVKTTRVEAVAAVDRLGKSLRGKRASSRRTSPTPSSDTQRAS